MKKFKAVLSLALCLALTFCASYRVLAEGYGDNSGVIGDELGTDEYPISSKFLTISEEYVAGIMGGALGVNAVDKFDNSAYIKFYDENGDEVDYSKELKTGYTVTRSVGKDTTDRKTLLLLGDINSDSRTTVADIVEIISAIQNKTNPEGLAFNCADSDLNGKLTVTDVVRVRSAILKGDTMDSIDFKAQTLNTYENLDYIKTIGRTYINENGIGCDISASGFEFRAVCEGTVSIKYDCGAWNNFRVYIDGVEQEEYKVYGPGTNQTNILAENLERGEHTFKICRMSEVGEFTVSEIALNGKLCPKLKENKIIEVIGDSMTCAAGSVICVKDTTQNLDIADFDGDIDRVMVAFTPKAGGDVQRYDIDYISGSGPYTISTESGSISFSKSDYTVTEEFYDADGELVASVPYEAGNVSFLTDGTRSYGVLTANNIGYDYNIFSRSSAKVDEMHERYPKWYDRNTSTEYVPARESDIIVINLATNSRPDSPTSAYCTQLKNFVSMLKEYHPNAEIVVTYGAMTQWYMNVQIKPALEQTVSDMGGEESGIYLLKFSSSRDGFDGHPSVADHRRMADELTEFIESKSLN